MNKMTPLGASCPSDRREPLCIAQHAQPIGIYATERMHAVGNAECQEH